MSQLEFCGKMGLGVLKKMNSLRRKKFRFAAFSPFLVPLNLSLFTFCLFLMHLSVLELVLFGLLACVFRLEIFPGDLIFIECVHSTRKVQLNSSFFYDSQIKH